jgi:hypothetical protein
MLHARATAETTSTLLTLISSTPGLKTRRYVEAVRKDPAYVT